VAVEDKSNEITAIPEVLRLLDLRGGLVSIDDIGSSAKRLREPLIGKAIKAHSLVVTPPPRNGFGSHP
jgi:predicted transposase YbfD/YdcC